MTKKLLNKVFNFFCFKDENEALVAGFAGTGEIIEMYEAIDILKKDRKRMIKQNHHIK